MHKSNQYLIRAQKPNVLSFLLNTEVLSGKSRLTFPNLSCKTSMSCERGRSVIAC
jgi:hypothetical protein